MIIIRILPILIIFGVSNRQFICFISKMSLVPNNKIKNLNNFNHYKNQEEHGQKKVNLNDLLKRLNQEEKVTRKNNVLLSVAAVCAVTVFAIILTI